MQLRRCLSASSVVDENIGSAVGDTRDGTLDTLGSNVLAETIGRLAKTQEVGSKADDVGGSHGGTRDGVGLAAEPVRLDVSSGSEHINQLAKVGVVGKSIRLLRSTDSAGRCLRGRGRGGSISALVTGSDTKEESGADNVGCGGVDGRGGAATEGHVDGDALGAVLLGAVGDDKLHALDDARVGTRAIGAEDLYGKERCLLGNTVLLTGNGTGAVRSVAIAIGVIVIGKVNTFVCTGRFREHLQISCFLVEWSGLWRR